MARKRTQRVPRKSATTALGASCVIGLVAVWACSAGGGNKGTGVGPIGGGGTPTGSGGAGGPPPFNGGTGGDPFILADSGNYHPTGGASSTNPDATVVNPGDLPDASDQPVIINENPGGIDPGTQGQLDQGGGGANGGKYLYPYDSTVFPVGLLPPVLMWQQQGTADAVRLHMKSNLFEYKGYFGANGKLQLPIPDDAWKRAGVQSKGAVDPLTVEITVKSGGNIIGPITETLIFALGKLKGDLFYNTYTSPQAANNGAVMRLHLGDTKPQVLLTDTGIAPLGPCWSCHSLSSHGNVLVAQHHQYPGGPYSSASFDLVANPNPQPPCGNAFTGNCKTMALNQSANGEMGLGAVYPDGTKVLTMGSPGDSTINPIFPDALGNVPAMIGPKASMLLDTATGQPITMNGFNVQYAKMPMFSPDGTMVVFNWHEDSNGHSLAVANFDTATNTMSNVHRIYKHDTLFPGWPFITPDNKEVVFVLGDAPDYVSAYPARPNPAVSDLWTVDIATGNARPLNRANGYPSGGGATYLPQPGRDEHLEYFPTLSPIAAGGYFWVFFTSRRTYGNIQTQAAIDAPTKKIWVSAFNIRGNDIIPDPSHPAFYLPGQEAEAGNIRAFAALEPCHPHLGDCETGVDCCEGKCYQGKCQEPPPPPPPPVGEPPPPPPCAQIDEQCGTVADCCDKSNPNMECIVHFCQLVEVIK